MLEFSSISVSTYDCASLAERLTEHSIQGWDVVSIVQTGTTVTAFISRPTVQPAALPEVVVTSPLTTELTTSSIGLDSGSSFAPSLNTNGQIAADSTAVGAATSASTSSATGTATSTAAAPAGWYADPANRFELRYWDGDKWTEYVSRGGEQFTDPPVA